VLALVHTVLARLRGLLRPASLDRDIDDEIESLLAMAEEEKVRRGLSRDEARRRARAELGGVAQLREAGRAAQGLPGVASAWLDLKLGVRLLLKYPGLTVVSTLALSIGIAIVAGFHAGTNFFIRPSLPVPEGERVVAIWNHDAIRADRGTLTLGDVQTWRDRLGAIDDLGTFVLHERVVALSSGPTQLVRTAQISPVVFGMLRVPPLLGRTLIEADAQPGSVPVAVVGFYLWRSAFGGDPGIVGRRLRVGGVEHEIVGVMPEEFAFPVSEQLWTPMPRLDGIQPGEGPNVEMAVGRLAAGLTLDEADTELQVLGTRLSAEYPTTHARVRPRMTTYARSFLEAREPDLPVLFSVGRWAIGLVLLLVAVNVGTLVYARNAARVGEVAVRTALGASRWRIALQMFAEAVVLASLAAGVGVAIMAWPLSLLDDMLGGVDARNAGVPYWFQIGIGTETTLLIVVLVIVTAILTGVLPALKLTSRRPWSRLPRMQEQTSALRFGGTATFVVVAQVAVSVALLAVGGAQLRSLVSEWDAFRQDSVPRQEYLTADLRWDLTSSESDQAASSPEILTRRAGTWRALGRRLSTEPDVRGVTFASFNRTTLFDMDDVAETADAGRRWSYLVSIEPNFFDVFAKPILAGRSFGLGDSAASRRVAIVNEEFLRRMEVSGQPIGRHIRPVDSRSGRPSGEGLEIVGVAGDFLQFDITHQGPGWRPFPTVYVPMSERDTAIQMTIHVRGEPSQMVARLRGLAAELDPTLVINRPESLDEREADGAVFLSIYEYSVGAFVFAMLLLTTCGTYSMMSFTVAQRTREIGIRTALGARPRQVVGDIFRRASRQLGAGAALGLVAGVLASNVFAVSPVLAQGPGLPLALATLLVVMGLVACGRPIRRALRIEPTEALRDGT